MADGDPRIDSADAVPLDRADAPTQPRKRQARRLVLMLSVPVLLLAGAIGYYVANDHYVSTDNAYLQQDKVSISAEVTGRIVAIAVAENQHVAAGDLLFRIDPEPYRIAVARADAAIAAGQVNVTELRTELATTGVDIADARETVAFAQTEYDRQKALMAEGFTTRARLDSAEHALNAARTKLATAQADAQKARAALSTGPAVPGENPAIAAARVEKAKALLDLSRTEIRAPVAGRVSQSDRLQKGQMMITGLPALSIVADGPGWIEANFKETDLDHMAAGQPATIRFDAYPELTLHGHVSSIGAGTGSEFSVLPAQNANGNWVKVTQRVPVRIAIDDRPSRPMIAGLSATVRIDTSSHARR